MYIHDGASAREFVSIWIRDASREWAIRHIQLALDGQLRRAAILDELLERAKTERACDGKANSGTLEAIDVLRAALAELQEAADECEELEGEGE